LLLQLLLKQIYGVHLHGHRPTSSTGELTAQLQLIHIATQTCRPCG
jgi:hypothetical protein